MPGVSRVKVVLLGDLAGQTQLINRYVNNKFTCDSPSTIACYFLYKKDNETKRDATGQERYASLFNRHLNNTDGCILVYDITRDCTIDLIHVYMKEIEKLEREDIKVILVGSRCDLEEKRTIYKQDGEKIAAKYGLKFFETSAKTGHNVDLVFTTLLKDIFSERTFHVDHVESQIEVDERKQINLGFFSKFKKVFSRTKPTYSIHSADSTNSRSSKENSSANGREIFTEQLLGDDRESPHQFAGTETVVEEFEPPDSQVLMPGPQVKTLDLSSCSQGTLQDVFNEPERANLDHISSSSQGAGLLSQRYSFEVDNIDEPEQADGKKSQPKAPTNDPEEDDGLKEDCAYIEPESRERIEPEPRDVVELESSLFLRSNDRNPTENVDNTDYKCLLNIPNIITDES